MPVLDIQRIDSLPATAVLSRLSDFAFVLNSKTLDLEYVNAAAASYLGWSMAELLRFSPWQEKLLTPASQEHLVRQLAHADREGQDQGEICNLQFHGIGGMLQSVDLHCVFATTDQILLLGRNGESTGTAEEILRQSNARFRSIIDSLSINLVLKDTDGRRVYANQAYLKLRNLQLDDVLGKRDIDLFPKDLAEQFSRDDQHVLSTGKVIHKLEENVAATGKRTWSEIIKGPIRDADDNVAGVQILFWDATTRKQTEQKLERERTLLHALLDNVPDSIYFKDKQSRFVRISRGMAEKFNLKSTKVAIGKTDADIFTSEHAEQALRDEQAIMRSGQPIVAKVERETWPDRPDSWCSTTKMPLKDVDGKTIGTFGISRDVTEMMQIERQLREARDHADQASKAKSEFLANMSHEIRTPMNGIIGMSELLSHTKLSDTQQSYLEMIQQSAQSLLRIINDILDFSKIEAGKLDIESVIFDLPKTISQAAKGLAIRAAKKSVELKLEIAADVPDNLVGDPDRLRQVLVNLAGNSIKFTERGSITIRVAITSGPPADEDYTLHFSVIDTGIGIPADKQASIFEAFAQADVSTTRTYGGTGLGLSISSQLVEMMGGKIWLESEVGMGSTFHFNCRLKPARRPQAGKPDANFVNLRALRALVVNDDTKSLQNLLHGLRSNGLDVRAVSNREQAIQDYQELPDAPDRSVLIVDQGMQSHDSIQLIEQLQSIAPSKRPITILLSALPDPLTARSSEKLKSVVILQKPALHAEICDAIRRVIAGQEQQASQDPQEETRPTEPLKLLIAEDGEVNRAILLGLLGEAGHETAWVEDGQATVDAWSIAHYDAILMDVQMPKVDGLEATRMIREKERLAPPQNGRKPRIPIVAITAGAMSSDQSLCFDAGMDDYLSKPIDFDALHDLLRRLRSHADSSAPSAVFPAGRQSEQDTSEGTPASDAEPEHVQQLNFDAPIQKLRVSLEQQVSLVETLKSETIQRLEELSTAISQQDGKLLVRASHSLKSAAAMFEARAVSHTASSIENAARNGDFSVANQRFAELREISNLMLQQIDAWLAASR